MRHGPRRDQADHREQDRDYGEGGRKTVARSLGHADIFTCAGVALVVEQSGYLG